MERNREARRGTVLASANGLSKRRQRSSNFKDSADEDGGAELQETARLRDRGSKKERDRDRSSRNKRRKSDKSLHGSNREEEGEETTEESVDDEEEEYDEDAAVMAVQSPIMNPTTSTAASFSLPTPNHHQRKSYPPKIVRPVSPWKADEMIGVSVPRKARSASVKRSHECWISGGGGSNGGEPIPRHDSTSPARSSLAAPVPQISPSSSNASVRKKMKPTGTKQRPPKISKPPSSIQEIEFEIAEVLYGMTKQFQCPSRKDTAASVSEKLDSNDAKASSSDAKSRVSSPSPITGSAVPQPSVLPQDSNSTAVAPKRKRPRVLKSEDENPANFAFPNASVASACKVEIEQQAEVEISSPKSKSEKNSVPTFENGVKSLDQISSVAIELPQDVVKTESNSVPDSDPRKAEPDGGDVVDTKESDGPVEESPCAEKDADPEVAVPTKMESAAAAVDCPREERFKFDLMAPPSGKSSPERDDMADFVTDQKPPSPDSATVLKKEVVRAEEKADEIIEDAGEIGLPEKKTETMAEENELKKQMVNERTIDLQLDGEKLDKDDNKWPVQKQLSKATRNESKSDKAVQSVPLPLPLTIASWPGGVPPIGYMGQIPPPLPTVVSMDGGATSSSTKQPDNFFLLQPRPKRCASHCYIARSIKYHKQFAHTNLFWPGAAGSALPSRTKQCNLNAAPPTESAMLGNSLQGSYILRNLSPSLDNGPGGPPSLVHTLKDKNSQAMSAETAQKKQQLMPHQAPQPASNNNMMAPAFIFPLNQQQAVAMTPGAVNTASTIGNAASSSSSAINSVVGSSSGSVSGSAATVSFNYANLQPNEAQYFAMLQSSGYPYPIPAPPPYRGSHHAVMPFFNGYYPQMIHPSQLQQQQQQSQPQLAVVPPGNQNTSTSSGSSSSQKHQQQQRLQGCGSNDGSGISQSFPALKHCQQPQQQYLLPARQPENDVGNHESPSAANSKGSHAQKSIYTPNFAMPIHPPNFTLMSSAALAGRNQGEKQQQQSLKGGMELNQSQAFAMSFATFGGATATPSLDFSSMMQNHPVFQSLPEADRHGYQIAASAPSSHSTQQKAAHQSIEEKPASASINSNASGENERKTTAKASTSFGHTLTFSRPDNEPSIPTFFGNSVVDSSSRNLSLISASGNGNRSISRSSSATVHVTNNPSSQHQQQLIQMQKQQQHLAAQAKPASSNANVYSDHFPGKFSNGISAFPQALTQSNSPSQSPQWKTAAKAGTTPIHSPSQTSISSSKSIPQQQCRAQLGGPAAGHKQISFGVSTRSSGPQFPSNNLTPPSASVVGSPPSSISKSGEGSPRSTTGSASASTMPLPSQPQKNTVSSSSRKSSPVGSQHVLPILSNSNANSSQTSTTKHHQQPQNQHQQQQQQLHKLPFPHSSQFFPNMYMQAPSPQSTTTLPTSGYYHKRQSEQQQQQRSLPAVSSSAMFSLCSTPLTFSGVAVSDPAKAIAAAATGNQKGLSQLGLVHAAQFTPQSAGNPHLLMPTAIPYMHSVPLKSAEQKPAAA